MLHWFLNLPILDGPVLIIVYVIAGVFAAVLLLRRPTTRWVVTALVAMLLGFGLAAGLFLWADTTHTFDDADLPREALLWPMAAFAGIGLAVANLWRSGWWRKLVAVLSIVPFLFAATVGINVHYGLNPTIGSIFGVPPGDPIELPAGSASTAAPAEPLYETWRAPAGMPATGRVGTQVIPATVSGFDARNASIYLPPAALVQNAPALPVIIFMMGFPGNPDPTTIAKALDAYAAQHDGLAPIAIVADQIGTEGDPACADSAAYGNAESYITKDVVAWAKAHLHIIDDPKYWAIGGYSNGGGCAIKYGAKYPNLFKNVLDISGEPFPGSLDPDNVTKKVYGGDKARFEAAKPVSILAAASEGAYAESTAVFTAGAEDATYTKAAQTVSDAAKAAGMSVTLLSIAGAKHVGSALSGGLAEGIAPLYPALGLAAP